MPKTLASRMHPDRQLSKNRPIEKDEKKMSTQLLSPATTLAELAVIHPAASRVFHRHGLDFCCHGRRPLAEACAERGLTPAGVIAEIRGEEAIAPDLPRWDERPLIELVHHIVDFYHQRLRVELPSSSRWRPR
jgi:regulator of cell morphogenesis and NO signaling